MFVIIFLLEQLYQSHVLMNKLNQLYNPNEIIELKGQRI